MTNIILGAIALWFLWGLVSLVIDKIRNTIEDNAIKTSGIKEVLQTRTQIIATKLDIEINQAKNDYSAFRELTNTSLQGIRDQGGKTNRQPLFPNHFLLSNSKPKNTK